MLTALKSEKRSYDGTGTESNKRIKEEEKLIWNNNWLTFKETPQLEHIQIDNKCSLKWCLRFLSNEEGDALFKHVLQESNFVYTEMNMIGKVVKLPRLQSWFAEEGLVVKELFQKQKQRIWTEPMLKLKHQLEKQLNVKFDYCLVNLYRNGDDYIGFHADNETKDVIASVSLGVTRRFCLKHISCFPKTSTRDRRTLTRDRKPLTTPETKEYEFSLSNGSLIVMEGATQRHWKHTIPKEKRVKLPRINLTFRKKRQ